jgi:hypothetical protein
MEPERWKQIDSLLQSVLEHRPDEREAFLRQDAPAIRRWNAKSARC